MSQRRENETNEQKKNPFVIIFYYISMSDASFCPPNINLFRFH